MPMRVQMKALKCSDKLPWQEEEIEFASNDEWASIEIKLGNEMHSIPMQKFISILSMLTENRETENLRKQIISLQEQIHKIKSFLVLD